MRGLNRLVNARAKRCVSMSGLSSVDERRARSFTYADRFMRGWTREGPGLDWSNGAVHDGEDTDGHEPRAAALTWSVNLRDRGAEEIERDVAALVEAIGHALGEHFPESSGYEAVWYRLSGPIDGVTVRVARGRFRAAASVQRFSRALAAPLPGAPARAGAPARGNGEHAPNPVQVRLVATASVVPPAGSVQAEASHGAGARSWAAASCALGTAAFGALAFGAAGLLTAWVQVLLLLPTFVVWRTTLALARPPQPSTAALAARSDRPRPRDPTIRDAIERWRRLLAHLETHRQLLDDAFDRAPFRASPRTLGATG